ncbi:MAG TPA: hypothetical protein VJK01_02880, partial [Candidatus Paceibacterota bacterium]
MTNKRKILIVLLVILALALAGFAVYYVYFRKTPGETTTETPGAGKPPAQTGVRAMDDKLKKISSVIAVSPIASADGQKILYAGKKGNLYETDFDGGNQKETNLVVLQNLIKTLWSPAREEFATIYANADGRKIFYNNAKTKKTSPYDAGIKSLAFSKSENKIAYYLSNDLQNTNAVFIADADGTNARAVFNTRVKDIRVEWVSSNQIAISTAPSGLVPNVLWVLNIDTQKLLPVMSQVYGFTMRWSPSGGRFLFSQTDAKGANLTLFSSNQTGTEVKNLGLATLPEKCAFSAKDENIVFCSAPASAPDIVWPDDYYKQIYSASEQIWSINLSTGKKDMVYDFDETLASDAADLIVSPGADRLIFLNKKDGA